MQFVIPNSLGSELLEFNPSHVPAGSPEGGQFARAEFIKTMQGTPWGSGREITDAQGKRRGPPIEAALLKVLTGSDPYVFVANNVNSFRAAVVTLGVLREMKAKGYEMPGAVRVMQTDDARDIPHGETSRVMGTNFLTVYVPSALPKGANLDDAARIAFGGKTDTGQDRFAGDTFRDIVIHEMGHVQVLSERFGKVYTPLPDYFGGKGDWRMLAALHVSQYAQKSPDEFLAEAFSRKYRGQKLEGTSEALYKELKGPAIR